MNETAYKGIRQICETHAQRLRWAMTTLQEEQPLTPAKVATLSPMQMAVYDQFVARFSKLQDSMGAKLLPTILELTREQGDLTAFIDKLNRLEKIGAIPSAAQWLKLREMRNQFAHDYPEDPEIQASLLNKAFQQAEEMLQILDHVTRYAEKYMDPQNV
jgi:hypothetical protein